MKAAFIASLLYAGIFAEEEVGAGAPKGDFDETQRKQMEEGGEKHEFQAEVSRLMDIIINSLYGEREVFVRELISNAVDAVEKARYMSVDDPSYLESKKELEIRVSFDKDAKTVSIADSGVGMTKADLINNLGTVAKSGTTNFVEALKEGADASLIGQFGVGFYSAFLVADKIQVISKHNSDPTQHIWESSADASFMVAPDPRGNTLGRGSEVKLFLKEDAHEFLSEDKLKQLALKYSKFAPFGIYLKVAKEIQEDDEDDDDDDDEEEIKDEDDEDEEEEKEKKEPKKKIVHDWELLNSQKPIWLQPKEDISQEDYDNFYTTLTGSSEAPLTHTHFSAEGDIEFHSIVYIPKTIPSDVKQNYQTAKSSIQLYVRRVLVAESIADFLPKYLNFVRGVVDSDDLPLNVSREQLQQNKVMKVISKKLVRKILDLLKKLSIKDDKSTAEDDEDDEDDEEEKKEDGEEKKDDEEKKEDEKEDEKDSTYITFYKEFEYLLKLGCMDDHANKSKIAKLLRFTTTKSEGKLHSLDKIIKNLKEGQESIYYIQGESLDLLEKKSNLQYFKEKDIEVLLLTGTYDESCLDRLGDFDGKKFASVQKADVSLIESAEEKKKFKKIEDMYKPLTKWWTELLKKDTTTANKVVVSKRLTTTPVVVVASSSGFTAEMERLYAAGIRGRDPDSNPKKVLEINPKHPLIKDILKRVQADENDATANKSAQMLFTTALLQAGYDVKDTAIQESFTTNLYDLMSAELGVDPKAEVVDVEIPEDEEEEEEEEEGEEKKEEKKENHDEL